MNSSSASAGSGPIEIGRLLLETAYRSIHDRRTHTEPAFRESNCSRALAKRFRASHYFAKRIELSCL